ACTIQIVQIVGLSARRYRSGKLCHALGPFRLGQWRRRRQHTIQHGLELGQATLHRPELWQLQSPAVTRGSPPAKQETEGIEPGAQTHAQIRHYEMSVNIVVAQPVARKPSKPIKLPGRGYGVEQMTVQRLAQPYRSANIQNAGCRFVIVVVRTFRYHPPQQNVEWLRSRKHGLYLDAVALKSLSHPRLHNHFENDRHRQIDAAPAQ